jgi:multidrug efflux pump subunit AcrA (membrane-fusion protein)
MLKNLDFKVKLSLGVLLIIILWVASGLFFTKNVVDKSSQKGGGKASLLASPIQLEEVYKIISGYGVIDRGEINVFSELNSHVLAVKKVDGSKVRRGEAVVELLSDVLVPSPIDGILDGINVRAGDVVFSGQTKMFSVVSDSKLEAILRISSSEARFVKAGQKAKIEVGENIFTGDVYFVSRVSDKASNTFEVKIRLKSSNSEIFHGEVAKISIETLKKSGIFVPTSALSITNDDKIIITTLDAEGIASKIPVEVLQTKENGVWVAGDLSSAKFVVIRGGDFANVGDKPDYKVKI